MNIHGENKNATFIFWDFDGVIKDSVNVKTEAFVKLFESYGSDLAEKVKIHHEVNGGMSRFKKFPLYLKWAGEDVTEAQVNEFCEHFSKLVLQAVIDSPWVPGAEDYLRGNPNQQQFVLVSATPQEELIQIIEALDIKDCFMAIFGSPMSKTEAIRGILNTHNISPEKCLMIGDALADKEAAEDNNIPFLLRRHAVNADIFADYNGGSIKSIMEL